MNEFINKKIGVISFHLFKTFGVPLDLTLDTLKGSSLRDRIIFVSNASKRFPDLFKRTESFSSLSEKEQIEWNNFADLIG